MNIKKKLLTLVVIGSVALLGVMVSFPTLTGEADTGEESPYLSGLWFQKGVHADGSICYTLIEMHSNLTEPGVSGTGFGSRPDPMEIPTPEGGKMIMSEELRATWEMKAPGEYKTRVLAFLRSEGMVMGMVELTGTMIRETKDKMSATWNTRIIDLEGNELAKLPPIEAELTRMTVD